MPSSELTTPNTVLKVLGLNFKDIDQPDLHRSEPSSSQTLRGEHPNRITTKLLVTGV